MMEVRALRSEEDYDWALAQIGLYFENPPKPGTPEADRFDVLADLIEAYERRAVPQRHGQGGGVLQPSRQPGRIAAPVARPVQRIARESVAVEGERHRSFVAQAPRACKFSKFFVVKVGTRRLIFCYGDS